MTDDDLLHQTAAVLSATVAACDLLGVFVHQRHRGGEHVFQLRSNRIGK
jgi:hypothetical protein